MRKARFHVSTQLTFRGATSISENWEDKFRSLANLPFYIDYRPVLFGTICRPLVCVEEIDITVDNEVLELTLFQAPTADLEVPKNLSQQKEAEECLREGR
jgi:hypothetical protein